MFGQINLVRFLPSEAAGEELRRCLIYGEEEEVRAKIRRGPRRGRTRPSIAFMNGIWRGPAMGHN